MPRAPIREPQNDDQLIAQLTRERDEALHLRDEAIRDVQILRTLMVRFLRTDQILELVQDMDRMRDRELGNKAKIGRQGPVAER